MALMPPAVGSRRYWPKPRPPVNYFNKTKSINGLYFMWCPTNWSDLSTGVVGIYLPIRVDEYVFNMNIYILMYCVRTYAHLAKKKPSASKETGKRRVGQIPFALKWLNVTLFHPVLSRFLFC